MKCVAFHNVPQIFNERLQVGQSSKRTLLLQSHAVVTSTEHGIVLLKGRDI